MRRDSVNPIRLSIMRKTMFDIGLPGVLPGKTSSLSAANSFALRRIFWLRAPSGTRCSRPTFILSAGIVHSFRSKSITSQFANKTSFVRAAVRIRNSTASRVIWLLRCLRRLRTNLAISEYGSAAWWRTRSGSLGSPFNTPVWWRASAPSRPCHLHPQCKPRPHGNVQSDVVCHLLSSCPHI